MTASMTDRIQSGRRHIAAQLEFVEAASGDEAACAHVSGIIAGARDYLMRTCGSRATYDFLQYAADSSLAPALAPENLEIDIAALLRSERRPDAA